ncbi:hypothetical protein P8935_08045 [Telmatobacter sp. DSM 110680]|uniref:Uncharacterized protein n=1 Tax=Telmatobacter sp. DSM 110680 TaxID=3036704 RepID=A0AAU7DPB3_9BACT
MSTFVPLKSKRGFDLSTTLFVATLCCICLAEAFMIRGLWFRPSPVFHRLRGFDLPFLVWIPAIGAFSFLQFIRRHTREGRISPALASNVSTCLALLILFAYLLITRFAQIAFH